LYGLSLVKGGMIYMVRYPKTISIFLPKTYLGRFWQSIDLVCKVEKSALENSSGSFRRLTFRVSFHRFMQKRHQNDSIPPKLSVANSFNNEGKLDCRLFKLRVSCRFFNKRDLWKPTHRQTKCCKPSRSTDRNDPYHVWKVWIIDGFFNDTL